MYTAGTILDVLTFIVLLVVIVAIVLYFIKLRRTLRGAGSFMCSYRASMSDGWTQGWAVYTKESLDWYPLLSLSQKPKKSWPRRHIEVQDSVILHSKDHKDYVQLTLRTPRYRCQLFMESADHSGLVSWMEAAPPIPVSWDGDA